MTGLGGVLSGVLTKLTPEEVSAINTTNEKHLIGKHLTYVTALVVFLAFGHQVLAHSERMALSILDSWLIFLAAYLGINVAQYGIKRGTDRDTQVAKEQAKAANAPTPVHVQAEDQAGVEVHVGAPVTGERPAPRSVTRERPAVQPRGPVAGPSPKPAATEPDLYTDDERGD